MTALRNNLMKKNMAMGDGKDSDERDQIDKNDEERVTYDIDVLKLEKYRQC